jgi:hypothetical protein
VPAAGATASGGVARGAPRWLRTVTECFVLGRGTRCGPSKFVDHIELILGPGSVLYGGNAMFGVINIVTRRAKAYRALRVTGLSWSRRVGFLRSKGLEGSPS